MTYRTAVLRSAARRMVIRLPAGRSSYARRRGRDRLPRSRSSPGGQSGGVAWRALRRTCPSSTTPKRDQLQDRLLRRGRRRARRPTCSTSTDRLPEVNRGNLISLATGDERTLFFDFLPVSTLVGAELHREVPALHGARAGLLQHDAQARAARRGRHRVRRRLAVGPARRRTSRASRTSRRTSRSTTTTSTRCRTCSSTTSATCRTSRPWSTSSSCSTGGPGGCPPSRRSPWVAPGVFETLNTVSRMVLVSGFAQEGGAR